MEVKKIFTCLQEADSDLFSGLIFVKNNIKKNDDWNIYLSLGRVFWVTRNHHRVRRWLRALRHYSPSLLTKEWLEIASQFQASKAEEHSIWEINLLDSAIAQGVISLNQAQDITRMYISENICSIIDCSSIHCEFEFLDKHSPQFILLDPASINEYIIEKYIKSKIYKYQFLESLPFEFSPDLAPIIKSLENLEREVSSNAYQVLTKHLNGKNTLRDISLFMKRDCNLVLGSLIPLIQKDIISFREVNDYYFSSSEKTEHNKKHAPKASSSVGTIACIDDSPVIGEQLRAIIEPLGYEVLTIFDPIKELSTLLNAKPGLIFLDIVMPNTNGYEICSYLRKTSLFKDLPIVMLTGHDGIVDKLRAKVSGSTDFLSKPPNTEEVRTIVKKYLTKSQITDG